MKTTWDRTPTKIGPLGSSWPWEVQFDDSINDWISLKNDSIQFSIQKKIVRIQFNRIFNSKLFDQFNSIEYSIQNYSWPIQFNEIFNLSLEFQKVLHDTVLHLESLNFGFGSPFGPCFMKNRVLAGSLFLDSRYPVLVTMVLPFSLKIWFTSIFWQWIFFWFIQNFWFIQCKNLNIDSKTYSSICFSAKIQFKVLFKT